MTTTDNTTLEGVDFLNWEDEFEATDSEGKKRTHTAPILRRFVESGEPGREVPLSIWTSNEDFDDVPIDAQRIKRDFENAKKAKEHDYELDRDVLKIRGADAVDVRVRNGRVFLLNRPVILAAKAAQETAKK